MAEKTGKTPGRRQRTIDVSIEGRAIPMHGVAPRALRIDERIGAPFAIDATFVSYEALDPTAVVGSPIRVAIRADGHDERRMHGFVETMRARVDLDVEHGIYEARIVPAISLLGMTRTQEVYIDTSLPDLIRLKLTALGMKEGRDFALRLSRDYPKREFIVQMDESDLALVLRLCEHLGVSLFFEHGRGRSVAVFTDGAPGFTRRDAPIHFDAHAEHIGVRSLVQQARAIPALVAVSDYNYTLPELDLLSIVNLDGGLGGGHVEYGATHMTPDEGALLARVRAEEVIATQEVFEGVANTHDLTSGHVVRFEGHSRLADAPFLVTSVVHRVDVTGHDAHAGTRLVVQPDAPAGDSTAAPLMYSCRFEAISAERPFRPARTTRRPRITGLLSGIVEAPPGVRSEDGQAFIDDRGRYLVRMLFDSARPGERKASLRVRMLQAHAGPNYGIHFPLRPGAEVMLGFEHGDPDRPVIVGSAPNALTPTPVAESRATLHRIRTWSGVQVEIDDGG